MYRTSTFDFFSLAGLSSYVESYLLCLESQREDSGGFWSSCGRSGVTGGTLAIQVSGGLREEMHFVITSGSVAMCFN